MASDLLGGMEGDASLLGSMDDSEAGSWIPETAGEGIQGKVIGRSTIISEYGPTEDRERPTVTVEVTNTIGDPKTMNDDGKKIKIAAGDSILLRGYSTILKKELERTDPKINDILAIKYFGKKATKDGKNSYHLYQCRVERATNNGQGDDKPPY